jgi:hypothetical protein
MVVVAPERKTPLTSGGERRSLIALSEIDSTFNDQVVKELARSAKLASADIPRLAESIRIAARIFLEAKARLSAPGLRERIERLYQLNSRAEQGGGRAARALARAVEVMPDDVRQWLLSSNPPERNIPTSAEILSDCKATRQRAVERFRLMLSYGGTVVEGRMRHGGRRSRSFKPLLRVPAKIERGRPRGEAERELVQWLAVAFVEAIGRSPPRTAHHKIALRGPFARFVHRCFELVGASTGNVTRLLNQYGAARVESRVANRTPRLDSAEEGN